MVPLVNYRHVVLYAKIYNTESLKFSIDISTYIVYRSLYVVSHDLKSSLLYKLYFYKVTIYKDVFLQRIKANCSELKWTFKLRLHAWQKELFFILNNATGTAFYVIKYNFKPYHLFAQPISTSILINLLRARTINFAQ